MAQLIGIIILIAVAIVAVKVALVIAFFLALIFRPKETIGLVLILGVLALFRNYPIACIAVSIAGTVAIIRIKKKSAVASEVASSAQITDRTGS